jgi:hypothetical protein
MLQSILGFLKTISSKKENIYYLLAYFLLPYVNTVSQGVVPSYTLNRTSTKNTGLQAIRNHQMNLQKVQPMQTYSAK